MKFIYLSIILLSKAQRTDLSRAYQQQLLDYIDHLDAYLGEGIARVMLEHV